MREDMKAGGDWFAQDEGKSTGAQKASSAPKMLRKELRSQHGGSQ